MRLDFFRAAESQSIERNLNEQSRNNIFGFLWWTQPCKKNFFFQRKSKLEKKDLTSRLQTHSRPHPAIPHCH
jgi:hypothetical protein